MDPISLLTAIAALVAAGCAIAALLAVTRRRDDGWQEARLLLEQSLAATRAEAETTRRLLADSERALRDAIAQAGTSSQSALGRLTTGQVEQMGLVRLALETKLREMAAANATQLTTIQTTVNEQLHAAVERQVQGSFQRVLDQFAAVQKAMGDVAATAAQIGDLKRMFANVRTRGGWGETQLRSLLDDVLPAGSYRMNCKVRDEGDELVEFAIEMPMRADPRPLLPIDAKFPLEDYQRLLDAAEAGDAEGERTARLGLAQRLRLEARKISEKYIHPPRTVEFAVMYLPTDGLYTEAARVAGLIEEISSTYRVLVLGPSLAPALLRTIQLGFVTLALEQKAGEVRRLLGATRTEMQKMDQILDRLGRQANTMGSTIEQARVRTRQVGRKLREVEEISPGDSEQLLELLPRVEIEE